MDCVETVLLYNTDIVEALIENLDVHSVANFKKVFKNWEHLCDKVILNKLDKVDKTEAFITACELNCVAYVQNNLTKIDSIEFNTTDKNGYTGFHWACKNKSEEIVHLLLTLSRRNITFDLTIEDLEGNKGFDLWPEKFQPDTFLLKN